MKTAKRDCLTFLYCLLAAAVCLVICSKSSFLYPINDWTDANAYLSSGKGMLAGRVMYRDLYEHKGPLLYALHALFCLVDRSSFLGVFVMEVLAGGAFLMAARKLMALYGASRASLWLIPALGAVVYASFSFQQGDSAEELCLPMLAWSLYGLLRWLRQDAPRRMSARTLLLNGFLGGCVLWVKFTMLGFYAPWLLGLMAYHLWRREGRATLQVLLWFAAGALLATLPWLVYFGLNGAILPWLKTYLYDNIFLYAEGTSTGVAERLKAAFRAGADWFTLNLIYAVPIALSMLWLTLCAGRRSTAAPAGRAASGDSAAQGRIIPPADDTPAQNEDRRLVITGTEKCFVWAMLGFTALGVFIGGKSYVYYGLILAAFAPLGVTALGRVAARWMPRGRVPAAILLVAALVVTGVWCLQKSPNVNALLMPRSQTMQYQFAAIVDRTPDATLLNYGFMDAGFYTACDIAPSVKYFHQTNVPLPEMLSEQERYVAEGVTDYVVTRGRDPASITDHYTLIATARPPANFWYDMVYLYRRKDIAP